MTISRKHFEAIAKAVRESYAPADMFTDSNAEAYKLALQVVATQLATQLGQFNENFDQVRFVAACEKVDS